jgi:ribosomal protein S18 acetylase RimI-like enzyme
MKAPAMRIRPFQLADEPAVVELWKRCELTRPWNDPHKDIARKMKVNPEMFLVGEIDGDGRIIASVMVGYEGHRGAINYLAVDPDYRRRGLGRMLIDEAERLLKQVGCPKINLFVRSSNASVIAFYESLGYAIMTNEAIGLGKRLIPDEE